MKTNNLFLITFLVIFGVTSNSNCQVLNNFVTSFGDVAGTSGYSVYVGSQAGTNTIPFNSSNIAGTSLFNTYVGHQAGTGTVSNSLGKNNTFLGNASGFYNNTGSENLFAGALSGFKNTTGNYNVFLGYNSGRGTTLVTGSKNTFIGWQSGSVISSGESNTFIGVAAGSGITTGSYNTFLGNINSTLPTINGTIILADGLNNQRLYIHSNGNAGIGLGNNVIPQNKLEVKHGVSGNSGLRFSNLNSTFVPTTTASKFLTVDANGDVVLQNASGTGGPGSTVVTAGQNIVVTGNPTAGYTIASPTTNTLTNNAVNTMTSTVNSVVANAPIVNTVVNTITTGQLTTTVNGVSSTPVALTAGGDTDTSIYANDGFINQTTTATSDNLRTVDMKNTNLFFKTFDSGFVEGTHGFGRIYIGNTVNFPNLNFTPGSESKYRLLVEGGILTEKVKVALSSSVNWADYVFANDYKLMPLKEVETFIAENKHLPGVSSAEELVKEGLDLGEMQAKQMAKIEELTLYAIEQNKKIEKQEKEIEELKVLVNALVNKNK